MVAIILRGTHLIQTRKQDAMEQTAIVELKPAPPTPAPSFLSLVDAPTV